jgi:hypothetical protein
MENSGFQERLCRSKKVDTMSGGLQQTFEGLENPGVVVHDCYGVSDCACHLNELLPHLHGTGRPPDVYNVFL